MVNTEKRLLGEIRTTVSTMLLSRVILLAAATSLLAAIGYRNLLADDQDPYRCAAALNTGRWIDPPGEDGHRSPFRQWQPDGCMMHQYTSEDVRHCMEGRHIVTAGDSTTRQVSYAFGRLLERAEAKYDQVHVDFQHSFNLTYHGIDIHQHWVPHLEMEPVRDHDRLEAELRLFHEDIANPKPIKNQASPALVMLGVGAWFAKPDEKEISQMDKYNNALTKASELIGRRPYDFITAPMDPVDGIGNQVIFAPPAGPYYNGTSPSDRVEIKTFAKGKMPELQRWLHDTDGEWDFPLAWAFPELIMHDNATIVDPTATGFHVIDDVADTKANILLNIRCNAKLDRIQGYPYTRTCCTDYGGKPLVQRVLALAGLAYLFACVVLEMLDLVVVRGNVAGGGGLTSRWPIFGMETGAFVMALLMCYYADRTQLMAKGEKVYIYCDFIILCAPCIALALITIRKSPIGWAKGGETAPSDQPFLSRDQTEEWKGWMQFVILAYHWTAAASNIGIYILVRLMVAAYLFQTGYGHTTFFLVKGDFSFKRAASVLLRLNLLSVSLAYVMNTDYMFYYFSPLVSFWFIIVYLTLRVGHERYNNDTQLLLSKIFVSAALVSGIILATPFMEWAFWALRIFFNIHWDLQEWEYRVVLDLFVVYAGMLAAVTYLRIKAVPGLPLRSATAVLGLFIMVGYASSANQASMGEYKRWHPYVSTLPILAFIAVRNVSGTARNYHSKAMAWLGKCSLETYTLQFHLFLAADTKGVLLVDMFNGGDGSLLGDRWRSLVLVVPVFLWISSATATATGNLVKIIMSETPSHEPPQPPHMPDMHKPSTGLLGRASRFRGRMPSARSLLFSVQTRIVLIVACMWILNLLSPTYGNTPAPDGFTPHRVAEGATATTPHAASGSAAP